MPASREPRAASREPQAASRKPQAASREPTYQQYAPVQGGGAVSGLLTAPIIPACSMQ
jgi:hypothetical protein